MLAGLGYQFSKPELICYPETDEFTGSALQIQLNDLVSSGEHNDISMNSMTEWRPYGVSCSLGPFKVRQN